MQYKIFKFVEINEENYHNEQIISKVKQQQLNHPQAESNKLEPETEQTVNLKNNKTKVIWKNIDKEKRTFNV